uniref:Nucleolar MIF4G domain-containing protein 1 n=1 Tax=Aceria tosichella TaxID=561515 RepID=A0A6G1SJ83_9ACAR
MDSPESLMDDGEIADIFKEFEDGYEEDRMDDDEEQEKVQSGKSVQAKARGLINRLTAQSMSYVASEFQKLYSANSRSTINGVLLGCIDSSLISKTAVAKRKIVAELMLLVSYLNHKISQNIGASLVHHLVAKFEQLYKYESCDEDKRLDNIALCLANLYIIGLISANAIYEITQRICSPEDFRAKSVELLLILLKNIGFQLRKDNPALMRQLIISSNEQCKQFKQNKDVDSRIEFMLETLGAIKNNNMSKIKNYGCDIDKPTIESTLKSLTKRIRLPEALSDATYNDMLESANFHLLERRFEREETTKPTSEQQFVGTKTERKICKALGFNKPAEKIIFSALLKVTDYAEASNILIGFGNKYCSDVMVVCLHVAIHEKKYNSFYYDLINNLCKYHRKYKMAAKFAIQDKIRSLSDMPTKRVEIFKVLTFELIKSDAIPITVLKSVEWANMNESTRDYLIYLLKSISKLPEAECLKIMLKSDKRSSFANAMRTFTKCFLEDCELFH